MPLDLTPKQPPYYTLDDNIPSPISDTIASIYRATITQTSTNAPVATPATSNTLTGIVWTRTGLGTYEGTKTGAFPINKTFINTVPSGSGGIPVVQVYRIDADRIGIATWALTSTAADDLLTNFSIEITITN